jgi:hypothetical protein
VLEQDQRQFGGELHLLGDGLQFVLRHRRSS